MLLLHEDLERRRGEGESVSEEWIRQSQAAVARGVISIMPEFDTLAREADWRSSDRRPEAQTASTAERRRKSFEPFCVTSSSRTFFCSAVPAASVAATNSSNAMW